MKNNTKQTKEQALQNELSPYFERVKARSELCSHLPHYGLELQHKLNLKADNEATQKPLCRTLATQELALWVKAGAKCDEKCFEEMGVTREQIYQHESVKSLSKEQARQQARQISDLLDAIYILESECFKTHEALVKLAQSISALDNFKQNEARFTGIHSFIRGYIFTEPIYEILSRYHFVVYGMGKRDCTYKYDLHAYDESALEQILLMKLCLKDNQTWLDESVAWLDECILRQKDFVPYTALDNPIPSDEQRPFFDFIMNEQERSKLLDKIAKERAVIKRADFEKFTPDEQEKLEQIAQKAAGIQRLIVGEFTKDGAWVDTQTLIDKARFAPSCFAPLWSWWL